MAANNFAEIAQLKYDLVKIEDDISLALAATKDAQKAEAGLRKKKQDMQAELARLEEPPKDQGPNITDHALIRYIERVMGLDVEAIRLRMAEEAAKSSFALELGGKIKGAECTMVVRENTVITTLTHRTKKKMPNTRSKEVKAWRPSQEDFD